MAIWARRAAFVLTGAWALLSLAALGAAAQTATPAPKDCSDFGTQEDAQAFFQTQGGQDPFNLDVDDDGKACEGLPSRAGVTTSPAPTPVVTPGTQTLPKNGAGTVAMALSGLTFLEAGLGLTLLSKRIGVRSRALPVYLMRKLVRAAREGRNEVALADDLYLVRRLGPDRPIDFSKPIEPMTAELSNPIEPMSAEPLLVEAMLMECAPIGAASRESAPTKIERVEAASTHESVTIEPWVIEPARLGSPATEPVQIASTPSRTPSREVTGSVYAVLARAGSVLDSAANESPNAGSTLRRFAAKRSRPGRMKASITRDADWPFLTPPS